MNLTDSFKHKGMRAKLIEILRSKGIKDETVLQSIGKVPRHFFMESFLDDRAYEDRAHPIASGQTISQPYTVAFQTELLEIKKGEKVLEIGTGSGYQTAVLLEMKASVYSIERFKNLFQKTQKLLSSLGYHPYLFHGDGYLGKPTYGPFDKILITAAAPEIPTELLKQLKVGGILVVPVGESNGQTMLSIRKLSEDEFERKEHGGFVFVPMLKGIVH